MNGRESGPHRAWGLNVYLSSDKGKPLQPRPGNAARTVDVRLDPVSAIGELLKTMFPTSQMVLGLLDNPLLHQLQLFPDKSDPTMSMSLSGVRDAVKQAMQDVGRRDLQHLDTPGGEEPTIALASRIFHSFRAFAARKAARVLKTPEAMSIALKHKTGG